MANDTELKVFLMDRGEDTRGYQSLLLRHPGTDETAIFLISNNQIYEVLNFNDTYRSWFIDDHMASDGRLYIPVPMDPLYFVLNYFTKSPTKAVPLDQLLEDDMVNNNRQLLEVIELDLNQVKEISDQRGPDDLKAFKYNEEKTLEWLKKKFNQVVAALKQEKVTENDLDEVALTSANYVKTEHAAGEVNETSYNVTAHGILSGYLNHELSVKLAKYLNIDLEKKEAAANAKRKSAMDIIDVPDVKKLKLCNESGPRSASAKEDKKVVAKNKSLAEAAKGSKSITSFFKKK